MLLLGKNTFIYLLFCLRFLRLNDTWAHYAKYLDARQVPSSLGTPLLACTSQNTCCNKNIQSQCYYRSAKNLGEI